MRILLFSSSVALIITLFVVVVIQDTQATAFQLPTLKKFSLNIFPPKRSYIKSYNALFKPKRGVINDIKCLLCAGGNAVDPRLKSVVDLTNTHILPALVRRFSDAFAIFATLGISISLRIPQMLVARTLRQPDVLPGGRSAGGNPPVSEVSSVRFTDVLGVDEAKAELEEVVAYLKDPAKFTRLGGKLPKGILLTGAPGTGKTLLAKAVAGEAGVPFFYKSGSEFDEMFVGVGSRRVRELFNHAKTQSPCIIFIDEIETIGASREMSNRRGSHHESLNQLLVELDGFKPNNGTIVIAATNFPSSLDSALTRPGRFDKKVNLPYPDVEGRKAILELYGKKLTLCEGVDLVQLARTTNGLTGADLANVLNQAALKAAADDADSVSQSDIMYALDKITMGPERPAAVVSLESIRQTAYHEAGHALVALKTPGCSPVHKASVVPRGDSLGMVVQVPDDEDHRSLSRRSLQAMIDVSLAGRAAEELIYGAEDVTIGAVSDIERATELANAMVTRYGFSNKIGLISIPALLRGKSTEYGTVGSDTENLVNQEIVSFIRTSYTRVLGLLKRHRKQLERITQGLIEYETLSGEDIVTIMEGGKLENAVSTGGSSFSPSRVTKPIVNRPAAKKRMIQ